MTSNRDPRSRCGDAKMIKKWHFGVSKTYAIPCEKLQSAPPKITKAILLIKPDEFWDFVARLASKFAKGTHPSSTSLMRFRDGAKSNFYNGKTNIRALATRVQKSIIKRRWLGSKFSHFREMRSKIIKKALGLSLVREVFSQNLKTLLFLRKTDGKIASKNNVFKNDEKALRKSLFLIVQNHIRKTL